MNRLRAMLRVTAVLAVAAPAPAAERNSTPAGWKTALEIDVTTTQTAYSDSWIGGEAGSVNWVGSLHGAAERQLRPRFHLRSTLKVSFGQTLTQDAETKAWSKPKKSTDLIDWETVGRFTLRGFVDPYLAARLETQFFDGRHPARKLYFSPLKLTESAGVSRRFHERNNDFVAARIGIGIRQIATSSIADPVTLATTRETVTDGGLEAVTDASLSLGRSLRYTGKLSLYRALAFSGSDALKGTPRENDWKYVDLNLESILAAAVARIVTVSLYTQLLFDRQVHRGVRIKETVAIGVVLRMP